MHGAPRLNRVSRFTIIKAKSALTKINADPLLGASDGIRTRGPRSHSAVLYR